MGLWQMFWDWLAYRPKPPLRSAANEDEIALELQLIHEGHWVKALRLSDAFVFPTTTERFAAWYTVADKALKTVAQPHQATFARQVAHLLLTMARTLGTDQAWSCTAQALARTCYMPVSETSDALEAIRSAAKITDPGERLACINAMATAEFFTRHIDGLIQEWPAMPDAERVILRATLVVSPSVDARTLESLIGQAGN